MSDYLTTEACQGQLRDAFPRLFALPADQAVLDDAIARVEATVNGYVGKRYVVPVTTPTEAVTLLRGLALALFAELAYQTRAAGSESPKKITDAADTARRQLADISKGTLSLAGAMAPESQEAGASVLIAPTAPPEFTRQDLEGF